MTSPRLHPYPPHPNPLILVILILICPFRARTGNRLATFLVYLNDCEMGGATCFKDINIQVKPQKGKALLFFPCYKDGKPDDRTTHAGQVAMDTKWIAQV